MPMHLVWQSREGHGHYVKDPMCYQRVSSPWVDFLIYCQVCVCAHAPRDAIWCDPSAAVAYAALDCSRVPGQMDGTNQILISFHIDERFLV